MAGVVPRNGTGEDKVHIIKPCGGRRRRNLDVGEIERNKDTVVGLLVRVPYSSAVGSSKH